MAKLVKAGHEIKVVFFAEGTTCRPAHCRGEAAQLQIEKRNSAARRALSLIGVQQVCFHNLPCGRLDDTPQLELNQMLEADLAGFMPSTVITHSADDLNKDHVIVNHCVKVATRPGAFDCVERVLAFEVLSSSEWNFGKPFNPNYFEIVGTPDLQAKLEAFKLYESEVRDSPHARSLQSVENLAKLRGSQVNYRYAEAFQIIRWVKQ